MRRILFVDDEPHVLDGLQNSLRKQRKKWDMVFAVGGHAALEELAKGTPFDVVVSDMRMPGMDGASLLARVQASYPSVARVILSGHAEQEAILRALPVSHQFLSKPCDGETLRAVIERVCELRDILEDQAIRELVGRFDALPSIPKTYWALTETVRNPTCTASDIADVIERDPSMSIKVLQVVNSAYFGLRHSITSIRSAVDYLGVELLKGLALSAHVFAAVANAPVDGFSFDQFQQESQSVARLAKSLVGPAHLAEDAFTAGLVHDIGEVILALGAPDRYAELLDVARASDRPFFEVEREIMQVTHAEIGAYLLGMWGLPFSIAEAVAFHHQPSLVATGSREVLAAVHAASAWVPSARDGGRSLPLDLAFLESAGFAGEIPRWAEIAARAAEHGE